MRGTMMDYPLTLIHILERAGKLFPRSEIISRLPNRSLHRYSYADFYHRSRALAVALQKAGLRAGDRVATLMWNHYAHAEAYFGIPVAGGVFHTLNLRLAPTDLAYIANHGGARFLIVDDILLPLFEKFKDSVKFERVIVVSWSGNSIPSGYDDYEKFLASAAGNFSYPVLDENDAEFPRASSIPTDRWSCTLFCKLPRTTLPSVTMMYCYQWFPCFTSMAGGCHLSLL